MRWFLVHRADFWFPSPIFSTAGESLSYICGLAPGPEFPLAGAVTRIRPTFLSQHLVFWKERNFVFHHTFIKTNIYNIQVYIFAERFAKKKQIPIIPSLTAAVKKGTKKHWNHQKRKCPPLEPFLGISGHRYGLLNSLSRPRFKIAQRRLTVICPIFVTRTPIYPFKGRKYIFGTPRSICPPPPPGAA